MNLEEARGYLMQALRTPGWEQVSKLLLAVGTVKAKAQGTDTSRALYGSPSLAKSERELLLEVIWSLIIQGILVPGSDDSTQGWPFLRLTEYGKQCVASDRILPHDPDGYLKEFRKTIPKAHPVIIQYLAESLQCYIHGLHKSAAVMLGAASEQGVILLIDSFCESISDTTKKTRFESDVASAPSIFRKYEVFEKRFFAIREHLPKVLSENLDSLLRGIFDLIRNSRNDAGHPARGMSVDRDTVYSHMRLFVPYCQRIYGLMDWFSANPT